MWCFVLLCLKTFFFYDKGKKRSASLSHCGPLSQQAWWRCLVPLPTRTVRRGGKGTGQQVHPACPPQPGPRGASSFST